MITIQILISLLILHGINTFPIQSGIAGGAFLTIGVASFVWWKRQKKKKIQKESPTKNFLEFANEAENHLLIWTFRKNYYYTNFHGWEYKIFEEENYRLGVICYKGEVIAKITYYHQSNVFGEVIRNEEKLKEIDPIAFDKKENAFAKLFYVITKREWKEEVITEEKEEYLLIEAEKQVRNHYPDLSEMFKQYQKRYIELKRYELHMSKEENKNVRRTLYLLVTTLRQSIRGKKSIPIKAILGKLNEEMAKVLKMMTKKYPKQEPIMETEDWDIMETSITEWSQEDIKQYFKYKQCYLKTRKEAKKEEELMILKESWGRVYQASENHYKRMIVLKEERNNLEKHLFLDEKI